MSSVGTIALIARREVSTRLFTKGNIWSMVIMVVIIVAAVVVGSILIGNDDGEEPQPVVAVEELAPLGEALVPAAESAGEPVRIESVGSPEEARTQVESGDAVAGLVGSVDAPELLTGEDTPNVFEGLVQGAAGQATLDQAIADLGGDPAAVQEQVAQATVTVTQVGEEGGFDVAAYLISFVILGLLFYLIVQTGTQIATGVVEEKTSRIVEILLATIRPWQLLTGKILGIGLVGFIQVGVMVGAGLIAAFATGLLEGVEVPIGGALGWSALWLLLGFLLFAALWGGAAALVSRQEEIGQVTTPLLIVLFIPFYATLFVVTNDPGGTLAQVLTYVPFSAPFAAPVRFAYGEIGAAEMLIAVAITLGTAVVLTLLAGRVYERGVLHTGGRLRLSQALSRGRA